MQVYINGTPSNIEVSKKGKIRTVHDHGLLESPFCTSNECKYVKANIGSRTYTVAFHRMIAALFVPIPKDLIEEGYTQSDLAVSYQNKDSNKIDTKNYHWIPIKITKKEKCARISDELLEKVCEMKQAKMTDYEISQITGISLMQLRRIFFGEIYYNTTIKFDFMNPRKYLKKEILDKIEKLMKEGKSSSLILDTLNQEGYSFLTLRDISLYKQMMYLTSEDHPDILAVVDIMEALPEVISVREFKDLCLRIYELTGKRLGKGVVLVNAFLSLNELTKIYSLETVKSGGVTFYVKTKYDIFPYQLDKSITDYDRMQKVISQCYGTKSLYNRLFHKKVPSCIKRMNLEYPFATSCIHRNENFKKFYIQKSPKGGLQLVIKNLHGRSKESRT